MTNEERQAHQAWADAGEIESVRALLADARATVEQLFKDALRKDALIKEAAIVLSRVEEDANVPWPSLRKQIREVLREVRDKLRFPDPQRPQGIDQEHEPQNDPDNGQGPSSHKAAHGPVDDHEHKQD